MTQYAAHLQRLVDLAQYQGFLTYEQASEFLPDESSHSGHTIQLLELLEKANIRLVDGVVPRRTEAQGEVSTSGDSHCDDRALLLAQDMPKLTDDPIRMYLSQMCEIPLLSREEEIALAKKIEITRKRFRRNLLWNQPHQWGARGPGIQPFTSLRHADHKLIYFHAKPNFELYDVVADPGETSNLIASHSALARELATRMDQVMDRSGGQYSLRLPHNTEIEPAAVAIEAYLKNLPE